MKLLTQKGKAAIDFSEVRLSEQDDRVLEDMKISLQILNGHFNKKFEKKDMREADILPLAHICEAYARICEEQRKRDMIRAMQKSNKPQ